jgi:hypothetical protein
MRTASPTLEQVRSMIDAAVSGERDQTAAALSAQVGASVRDITQAMAQSVARDEVRAWRGRASLPACPRVVCGCAVLALRCIGLGSPGH